MSRTVLPLRPDATVPVGFPVTPSPLASLWEAGRWHPRGWSWLVQHVGGISRAEVFSSFTSDDVDGATFVARLAGDRLFVIVYADRDVLAATLRRMKSLRGVDGLDDVLSLLDGVEV